MIRPAIAALALLAPLFVGAPLAAQSQADLDARYDRALAAGYKALFLCSAIANAERNGATRTPESVENWELTGIQAPLDEIVGGLLYQIERHSVTGDIALATVSWADGMAPRIAIHEGGSGCSLYPVGTRLEAARTIASAPADHDINRPKILATFKLKVNPSVGARKTATRASNFRAVFERAFRDAYGIGTRTTAVQVGNGDWSEGRYLKEFAHDEPQRTWSVAKSIAATLIGAAVQRGEADVRASAGLGVDASDPRRAITLDNLLRMASGRYSDTPGNRTDPIYFGGATVDERAAVWPLIHPPGTVFRYANNDILMAIKAIAPTFAEQPPAELFAKLGMHDTVAETDWQGNYILSSQVWSTARDLAQLGQLYLDDGVLPNGERVLPEGWRDYVSSPAGPQPEGPFGYGAGFWLLNHSEGVPPDTFAAFGNRGQYVVIVPSRNVVIVRRGEDPVGARFDIAGFTRDVLAVLGD